MCFEEIKNNLVNFENALTHLGSHIKQTKNIIYHQNHLEKLTKNK